MWDFVQIILINLAVSCDNIGVIALATRALPAKQAVQARRIGIGLSVLLKLLFVAVIGLLFEIPWLHIRIIGGVLLLYVTFNMLRHSETGTARRNSGRKNGGDSFIAVIVSIIAADVSMSLDNVLAVLSIVAEDAASLGMREMLLISAGLLTGVPILLWFSGTVSRLMERYSIIIYLCAGYLVYTSFKMIFGDSTLVYFFRRINFAFAMPTAVLFGIMTVAYALCMGSSSPPDKSRSGLLLLCFLVVIHALISLVSISYLSTNPVEDGVTLGVEMVYNFAPNGANAIYAIGEAFDLLAPCTAVYVGIMAQRHLNQTGGYAKLLKKSTAGMLLFVLLQLAVSSLGFTYTFGFGSIVFPWHFLALILQVLLLGTYLSVFCMIAAFVQNRFACIALGMVYVFAEHILTEICFFGVHSNFLAGFLPSYYIFTLPGNISSCVFLARTLLISLLIITASTAAGYFWFQKRRPKGGPYKNKRVPVL